MFFFWRDLEIASEPGRLRRKGLSYTWRICDTKRPPVLVVSYLITSTREGGGKDWLSFHSLFFIILSNFRLRDPRVFCRHVAFVA